MVTRVKGLDQMPAGIRTPRVPLVLSTLSAFTLPLELFSGLLFACLITSLSLGEKKKLLGLSVVFEMYVVYKTTHDLLLCPLLVFSLLLPQTPCASDKAGGPFPRLSLASFSGEFFLSRALPLHPPGHF